jgi:hypothetical protein
MNFAFELQKDKDLREVRLLEPDELVSLWDIFLVQTALRRLGFVFPSMNGLRPEGGLMDRIDATPLFTSGGVIGVFITRLEDKEDYSHADLAKDLAGIEDQLQQLCDLPVFLPHSKEAAQRILSDLKEILGETPDADKQSNEIIPQNIRKNTTRNIGRLADRLGSELSKSDLYFVSEKRIYSAKGLIFNAEKMLPEKVIEAIPEQCKRDVQEAGRAIAFDLPTAAGFHISRALETVVLMYFPVLDLEPLEETQRSLGKYINLLKGQKVCGQQIDPVDVINDRITGLLGYFKDEFRNPLMHPELLLDDDEALDLFQAALSAISMMATDIISRKAAAP